MGCATSTTDHAQAKIMPHNAEADKRCDTAMQASQHILDALHINTEQGRVFYHAYERIDVNKSGSVEYAEFITRCVSVSAREHASFGAVGYQPCAAPPSPICPSSSAKRGRRVDRPQNVETTPRAPSPSPQAQ